MTQDPSPILAAVVTIPANTRGFHTPTLPPQAGGYPPESLRAWFWAAVGHGRFTRDLQGARDRDPAAGAWGAACCSRSSASTLSEWSSAWARGSSGSREISEFL